MFFPANFLAWYGKPNTTKQNDTTTTKLQAKKKNPKC